MRSGGLPSRPKVDVRGVPFLTQVLRGRYDRVDVVARDVPAGEVAGAPIAVSRLSATLRGARVPLADALSGTVPSVPVDRVDAEALLPYSVLERSSDVADLTVAPEGDRLRLRGSVEVFGRELEGSALSRIGVDGGVVVVTAERIDVGIVVASDLVTEALADRFDVRVPLGGLPYGLRVDAVEVQPDGLAVAARATGTVLSPPPA